MTAITSTSVTTDGSSRSTEGCLPHAQPGCQATNRRGAHTRHPAGRTSLPSFLPNIHRKLCSKKQYLEAYLQLLTSQSCFLMLSNPECGREWDDTFTEPHCPPSLCSLDDASGPAFQPCCGHREDAAHWMAVASSGTLEHCLSALIPRNQGALAGQLKRCKWLLQSLGSSSWPMSRELRLHDTYYSWLFYFPILICAYF